MTAIARLAAVSLDCADPGQLADFYCRLLGTEVFFQSSDFVAIKGAAILITAQRIDGYQPPDWPTGPAGKQIHLELAVDDLDSTEAAAVAAGARKATVQPRPEVFRVLLDPAGHPFCLTNRIPDA